MNDYLFRFSRLVAILLTFFLLYQLAGNLPFGNDAKVWAGNGKALPLIGQRLLGRLQGRIFLYLLCCKEECGSLLSR